MQSLKKQSKSKSILSKLIILSMLLTTSHVFAGLNGGFSSLKSDTSSFQNWLYGIVGVVGLAYLSFIAVQIKAGKKSWQDLIIGFLQVAAAGAAVTAGTYFYGMFAS